MSSLPRWSFNCRSPGLRRNRHAAEPEAGPVDESTMLTRLSPGVRLLGRLQRLARPRAFPWKVSLPSAMGSLDQQRLPQSGDESGSAPEDRAFRPDVEGLRVVAIVLVVLFHAYVWHMHGGFVGVDVFFVISGFVITGLLLREQAFTGRIAFLAFYARRARRLLPAAIFVITASLIASWLFVGAHYATLVASDARWSALFMADFHFISDYPTIFATRPGSPLMQYWSLAVEEQFYLVYPAFFVVLLKASGSWSIRARLSGGLGAVILISFLVSVATSQAGYFEANYSPFTRAWELALGALVAVWVPEWKKIPKPCAAAITWVGLAGIVLSAAFLSWSWAFPGYIAAWPAVGTALVIMGGTAVPRWGAEKLLRTLPFRWIGRWSYSWYLWNSAVLAIFALDPNSPRGVPAIVLVTLALPLAIATYFFVENPIRHLPLFTRSPRATLLSAGFLIASCVALTFAF